MPRGSNGAMSLAQLERLLNKRKTEISRLLRRRATVQKRLDNIDDKIRRAGGSVRGSRGGGGGRARNERSLADVIHDVLSKKGEAMRVQDIADAVESTGYRSNSANFRGIVNQMLIKDKRFTSPGRGFYQAKK
jgi:hypothetical protein